uniref:Chitin-binding type-2 domain-containing protein n=1 Tax=Syphacia muris TaxID=451379 RepID=A0A0N5AJA0_9BILA
MKFLFLKLILLYALSTVITVAKAIVFSCVWIFASVEGFVESGMNFSSFIFVEVMLGFVFLMQQLKLVSDSTCKGRADGVYGVDCSQWYLACVAGNTFRMQCPPNLYFNSKKVICDYQDKVPGCSEKQNSVLPVGVCKQEYLVCKDGVGKMSKCDSGLFYDANVKACSPITDKKQCVYRSAIPSCHLTPDRIQHTALQGNLRQKTFEFDADRSQMFVCGKVIRMPCAEGLKYDLALSRCVPEKYSAERFQTRVAEQCKDRSIKIPLQISCRRQYYTCKGVGYFMIWFCLLQSRFKEGSSHRSLCSKNEVFSLSKKKCVGYTSCTSSDDTDIFKSLPDFCSVRVDGMYKHPNNCSRIIQCYKGEGFEHFPCSSGLVFNEVSALCDYAINHPQSEGEFLGLGHCSRSYYRCSLGRPVSFQCPENTVYNHVWNVCDYRENVESCT